VTAELIALPTLSLGIYVGWYLAFQNDIRICDEVLPPALGLFLFLGPVVEIVRIAEPKRITGRTVLLGLAAGVAAAVLVFGAAYYFWDSQSCWE
jgi:hypothetical protein